MSRVNEALRRVGQTGEEPGLPENDDSQFVIEEGASEAAEPEAEVEAVHQPSHQPSPRVRREEALIPRARRIPVQMVRDESRDDIRLVDVARLLWSRWKLIAGVVAATMVFAVIYNSLATPIYQARARLIIDPESPAVVPFKPLTDDTGRFDYYTTQLDVLRSGALARKAAERLHMVDLPGELGVTPARSDLGTSRVVNVSFVATDPKLAADVVNTLARTYVDENLELRRQGSRDAAKWLNERLAELRQQVDQSQNALQQYREQRNSVSLGTQQNIVLEKLAQLSTSVTTARTERLAQEALYQQLRSAQDKGLPLDSVAPILSNNFIQGQKAELASLQRERAQLAERLGDLHPDMVKMNSAIATSEGRLKVETDKVVEGIANDYRTAVAKERALIDALEAQKREVLSLNEQSIGYGALQRDATSTQQIFDSVLQRLKETELSGELQANNVRILDQANPPRVPIAPRTWMNLMVALVVGIFIAVALVLALEYLNPRITKPHDVSEALGLPLLGVTPTVEALKKARPVVGGLPPEFQEALRGIRTRILLSPVTANVRTLAVTSTMAGEGKTVIASSLAISMAIAGRRVLLVDADMRRPQLHTVFGVPPSPGLANVMAGETKPSEALLKSKVSGLFILPAGANVPNPSDLLDSERLQALIDGFRKVFDVVVLDCPPVMALADASIMANAASSVLFVVGAGASTREGARVAVERLTSVQAQVIGVVLNNAKSHAQSEYYAPYYHAAEIV
jgi:polysaccharide biosynthesis transport protein